LNSRLKSPLLLLVADLKPDLDQLDSPGHNVVFQLWAKLEKPAMLLLGAKAHDILDAGAVVPTAVENYNFGLGRKVLDVALEIDLALLAVRRGWQRHHPESAGADAFRESLDGAALSGRIAAFKDDDDLQSLVLHPLLKLAQLSLKFTQF